MKVAVIAYPVFHERDQQWIEALRRRRDPRATKIQAHFTLVFPADMVESRSIEAYISAILLGRERIPFIIQEARAVGDPLNQSNYVFLVPEKRRKTIVDLHDKLYRGGFRPDLNGVFHLFRTSLSSSLKRLNLVRS